MKRPRKPEIHAAVHTGPNADAFPPTLKTWIQRKQYEGDAGRAEINHHIMSVYAFPLKVYLKGTDDRSIGEYDDVINGFFETRLSRTDFFAEWLASGMRLRRWLVNGLHFHLHELRRVRRNASRFGSIDEQPAELGSDDHRRVDNAFVVALTRQALAEAERACREKKLEQHWNLFVRHTLHGRPYAELAGEFDVPPERAVVMNRTAEQHLKSAVRSLLERDGVPAERIDEEIRSLLEDPES